MQLQYLIFVVNMAVFSLSRPQSMYAVDPQYATGAEKARLALLGYKASGEQNAFGKVMSWMGPLGLAQNVMARNYTKKIGATDAWENVKEDTDNRVKKLGIQAGAALMAAGGIVAAPALAGAAGAGAAGAGAAGATATAAGSTAALGGVAGAAGGASAAATAAAGAAGAAGAGTAATIGTELFKSGLGMTSNFAGMLAFDQDDGTTDDSNYIYR